MVVSVCVGLLAVENKKWWGDNHPVANPINNIKNKITDNPMRTVKAFTTSSGFPLGNKIKYNPDPKANKIPAIKA